MERKFKLIRAKRYSQGRWHETNTLHDDTDKINYRFNIAVDDKGSIRLVWNEKYGEELVMFSLFFNAAIKKWSVVPERIDRYLWQDLHPVTVGNRSGTVSQDSALPLMGHPHHLGLKPDPARKINHNTNINFC